MEIDPGFRLFLHTSLEPQYIREELAAVTTVLRLDQSRDDTMEQMLDRFLTLEKPRLQEERRNLQKVWLWVINVNRWLPSEPLSGTWIDHPPIFRLQNYFLVFVEQLCLLSVRIRTWLTRWSLILNFWIPSVVAKRKMRWVTESN